MNDRIDRFCTWWYFCITRSYLDLEDTPVEPFVAACAIAASHALEFLRAVNLYGRHI